MSDTTPISGLPLTAESFGMGRVVTLTFRVIGRNPVAIVGVALLVALLASAASFGAGLLGTRLLGTGSGADAVIKIVDLGLGLIFGSIGTGAITHVALRDIDDRRVGIGPAVLTGIRLALPLAGLGIVMGIGIGLASLLILVPGIMLALRWAVATPARVAEGPGLGNAMSRSADLTSGHRWALFGLAVAFALIVGIFSVVSFLLLQRGGPATAGFVFAAISQILTSAVYSVLLSTGIAACYAELRRVKEGATPDQLASVFA